MVKGGEGYSHKYSRITGIKIYNANFHKEFATLDDSCLTILVDNKVALAYLLKIDGIHNPQLLKISESIWNNLLSYEVTITAE